MASGPDHYRRAEELVALASGGLAVDLHTAVVAEAQVHATLALAAATAHGLPAADWPDALEAKVVEDEPS